MTSIVASVPAYLLAMAGVLGAASAWAQTPTQAAAALTPATAASNAPLKAARLKDTARSKHATAPSVQAVRNAAVFGLTEIGRPVRLREGQWTGRPEVAGSASVPTVMILGSVMPEGRVEGLPMPVRVATLSVGTGGTGQWTYLAAFVGGPQTARLVGLVPLGDRTQVRGVGFDQGQVWVDTVEVGPQDGACCGRSQFRVWVGTAPRPEGRPFKHESAQAIAVRQRALKAAQAASGEAPKDVHHSAPMEAHQGAHHGAHARRAKGPQRWVVLKKTPDGQRGLQSLAGAEWTLRAMDTVGAKLPADRTAPTLKIDGNKVSGFGGCNRLMGGVKETADGGLAFERLASTMMACEADASATEERYKAALATVQNFYFQGGELRMPYKLGQKTATLVFSR